MKIKFEPLLFRVPSLLICCSSHEDRCAGILRQIGAYRPMALALIHHDDLNPRRELNHRSMVELAQDLGLEVVEVRYTKSEPSASMAHCVRLLSNLLAKYPSAQIVLDISVLTRIHMFMLFQWFDDADYWHRLCIAYSEPETYFISEHIPLSFGLHSFQQIPGFAACANFSRSTHLMVFLGYEGDRSVAAFEYIQPEVTTLVVPRPPYQEEWVGWTERFNVEIIRLVGSDHIVYVDPIDPIAVLEMMTEQFGEIDRSSARVRVIVPTGTKPQALGAYMYTRQAIDQPSIVYVRPLRYNTELYSAGVGKVWRIK